MKATELRIGNWVEYQGEHFKIYGINHDIPFLDTIEFGDGVVQWKDIKPIPLTEEWLEMFGFISDPYHDTYIKGSFTLNCDKTRGKLALWPDNVTGKVVYIKYAHKLQNLFFEIEGEELQLK